MSLIHTCELNDAIRSSTRPNCFGRAEELKQKPSEWMAWNYRDTLARLATPAAA